MKDQKTLSYLNLYAVLKDIELLCELDERAKAIAQKDTSISVRVIGGGQARLIFGNGKCEMRRELGGRIKLLLTSPEKLNQMVDGTANPLPYWGFTQLGFLLKGFSGLADILGTYLKATPEALKDAEFFKKSTKMMFYLIANALSVLGEFDELGKLSAQSLPDGEISMEIKDQCYATIRVKDHKMTTINEKSKNPRSFMIFDSYETARGMFDGSLSAMTCLAQGKLEMSGYIPMIDNLNRILNRVAFYLG
ncbi:MAG: hypothetical protein RR107_02890 [Clostridia bacterium]